MFDSVFDPSARARLQWRDVCTRGRAKERRACEVSRGTPRPLKIETRLRSIIEGGPRAGRRSTACERYVVVYARVIHVCTSAHVDTRRHKRAGTLQDRCHQRDGSCVRVTWIARSTGKCFRVDTTLPFSVAYPRIEFMRHFA